MKTYEITLTSKNQITIPADVVRKLKLSKNRVLEMTVRDNKISLTPEQSIRDALKPYWSKHHSKNMISIDQMNDAIRKGIANNANIS